MANPGQQSSNSGADPALKPEIWLSEEKFHKLVESVMDYAIFMLDPGGYVVSWNRGAERIKGYKESDIVGRHFSTFYTREDIERGHPEEELQIAVREGRFEEEGWRVRKDGSLFWANVVITAIFEEDGTLWGFAKVTRDMTHRRQMEQELRDLNRQLESFAYSVSHDLRAPLRNIAFTSRLLIEDYGTQLDEEGRGMLESLSKNALNLARVISDLLTLSRLSRAELRKVKVDISQLATEIWEEARQRLEPNLLQRIEIEPSMPAFADRNSVRVILQNLLDNAVKFSPEGVCIKVGSLVGGDKRVFYVRDHGIGFEMEYAHKIFQPFQRLVNEQTFPGSGIGLANVQQSVLRHGGKVWVESEPGEGTTFYFTLD